MQEREIARKYHRSTVVLVLFLIGGGIMMATRYAHAPSMSTETASPLVVAPVVEQSTTSTSSLPQ